MVSPFVWLSRIISIIQLNCNSPLVGIQELLSVNFHSEHSDAFRAIPTHSEWSFFPFGTNRKFIPEWVWNDSGIYSESICREKHWTSELILNFGIIQNAFLNVSVRCDPFRPAQFWFRPIPTHSEAFRRIPTTDNNYWIHNMSSKISGRSVALNYELFCVIIMVYHN